MIAATSTVHTPHASKYLQQLCKHFAHKVTVEYDARKGRADLPPGPCAMTAEDGSLSFHCRAKDEQGLQVMQAIIQSHLVKFAWREDLVMTWEPCAEAKGVEGGDA